MKRYVLAILAAVALVCAHVAFAKGGFSGGGGGRSSGGFSSSPRAPSYSPSRSSTVTTTSPGIRSTTVTTTSSSRSYGGSYGPGMAYGGMGMGYGYSNGMLTGLLIGNMLHPQNTVVYSGPGGYGNNALLYPDGRVVNGSGQLVGNYTNGSFTAVDNGPIVAQAMPQQQPQPVVIKDNSADILIAFLLIGVFVLFLFIILI